MRSIQLKFNHDLVFYILIYFILFHQAIQESLSDGVSVVVDSTAASVEAREEFTRHAQQTCKILNLNPLTAGVA